MYYYLWWSSLAWVSQKYWFVKYFKKHFFFFWVLEDFSEELPLQLNSWCDIDLEKYKKKNSTEQISQYFISLILS